MIDDALNRKDKETGQTNAGLFSIINPQEYEYNGGMKAQIDDIAQRKAELKLKKHGTSRQQAMESIEGSEKSSGTVPIVRT